MGEEQFNGHERFSADCAFAVSGTLTASESAELKDHLQTCLECREAYREYVVLTKEGIPYLASRFSSPSEEGGWDDTAARRRLFARVTAAELPERLAEPTHRPVQASRFHLPKGVARYTSVAAAVAACIALIVSVGAYRHGRRIDAAARKAVASAIASANDRVQKLASEKKAVDDLLSEQGSKLILLQAEGSLKQKEIERLQSELDALQQRMNDLVATNGNSDEQLRSISQQRDVLIAKLHEARRAYDGVQNELSGLHTDSDTAASRLASLETQVSELAATNLDLNRRLESADQFLLSDRDIRELMGARNLYIADVFDVDSSSRTRKPFGRVFYTRGKSLIFYAFDLDRQPGSRNASAFQAWGKRETVQGETAQAVNLGILYVDNETNRRWALRCDDPQQLAQIDAVFVTVEPRGGSQKPTGKPFLYAMLRKEANHP